MITQELPCKKWYRYSWCVQRRWRCLAKLDRQNHIENNKKKKENNLHILTKSDSACCLVVGNNPGDGNENKWKYGTTCWIRVKRVETLWLRKLRRMTYVSWWRITGYNQDGIVHCLWVSEFLWCSLWLVVYTQVEQTGCQLYFSVAFHEIVAESNHGFEQKKVDKTIFENVFQGVSSLQCDSTKTKNWVSFRSKLLFLQDVSAVFCWWCPTKWLNGFSVSFDRKNGVIRISWQKLIALPVNPAFECPFMPGEKKRKKKVKQEFLAKRTCINETYTSMDRLNICSWWRKNNV